MWVWVDAQGRVLIPAKIRRALGLAAGTRLVLRATGTGLVLERPDQVLGVLRARFATVPRDVSLADELLAERREEAKREAAE